MTKKRWPFQATIEDKQLIDAINAARPLDRTSVADGIRYALRYTAQNDREAVTAAKALAVVSAVGGHIGECIGWLNDGDGDTLSVEECILEWDEIGASYLT